MMRKSEKMDNQNKPKKPESNGMLFGTCIGLMLGVALGCWLDNLGLWMCVGVAVGVAVGTAIDSIKNKKDK